MACYPHCIESQVCVNNKFKGAPGVLNRISKFKTTMTEMWPATCSCQCQHFKRAQCRNSKLRNSWCWKCRSGNIESPNLTLQGPFKQIYHTYTIILNIETTDSTAATIIRLPYLLESKICKSLFWQTLYVIPIVTPRNIINLCGLLSRVI